MENKVLIEVTETGMGRPENPYDFYSTIRDNNTGLNAYQQFNKDNPLLPSYKQDGETPLEEGKYRVELVKQFYVNDKKGWRDCKGISFDEAMGMNLTVRTIYRQIIYINPLDENSINHIKPIEQGILMMPIGWPTSIRKAASEYVDSFDNDDNEIKLLKFEAFICGANFKSQAVSTWLKVKDAPRDGSEILGYDPDTEQVYKCWWNQSMGNGCWNYDGHSYIPKITHWMPLPEIT